MARAKDREKALSLRKQGMSYSQIKKIIGVGKGTLSNWLRDHPLSKERIRELVYCNEQRIERCRETKRKKKEQRLLNYYNEEKKNIFPLTKREFYLAGLVLYWGEGTKRHLATLAVTNTDPAVIKFFIIWTIKALKFPKEKIKMRLHLYTDMDIKKETLYWSKTLNIPPKQFTKPYIKQSSSERINYKGRFGHGTCVAQIGNARTTEKILMALKAIADKYNEERL